MSGTSSGAGRALIPFVAAPRAAGPALTLRHGLWATGLVLAFGVGALGVHAAQTAWATPDRATVQAQANAQMLAQLEGEIARLRGSVDTLRSSAEGARQDDSLRNLKHGVETLKAEIEQVRSADGATLAQISTKIDKVDHDPTQKLADIVARLDRMEHEPAAKPAADAAPKVADLSSRIDRLEKQVSSPATTGSLPPAAHPASTTSVPRTPLAAIIPPKPEIAAAGPAAVVAEARPMPAKPPTVGAWVLRDVYGGMALVEAREGGLREVGPGEFLPGAGKVRSIERRGRDWVVLTSRGVIEAATF